MDAKGWGNMNLIKTTMALALTFNLILASTTVHAGGSACRNVNIQLKNQSPDTVTVLNIDYKNQNKWINQLSLKKPMQAGGSWTFTSHLNEVGRTSTQLRVSFTMAQGSKKSVQSPAFKCSHGTTQNILLR